MAIEVAGKRFVTLADEFFVNGSKVYEAWANGVKVYPDGGYPDAIKIIHPPNKITYVQGETIDYTGIIVQLMIGDSVYKDSRYPDGIVPFDELILPTHIAEQWLKGVEYPFRYAVGVKFDVKFGGYQYTYESSRAVNWVVVQKPTYSTLVMSSTKHFDVTRYYHGVPTTPAEPSEVTYRGEMAYVYLTGGMQDVVTGIPTIIDSGYDLETAKKVGWLMAYKDLSPNGVPVYWESPYSHETFEDEFGIEILLSNGG